MLGEDEYDNYYRLGGVLYQEGYSHPDTLLNVSPHGYSILCSLAAKGRNEYNSHTARDVGTLHWGLLLALVAFICRASKTGSAMPGVAACIALTLCPWALQAANIIELDQAILPFYTLLLAAAAEGFIAKPSAARGTGLALTMTMALWCRLTTPLLMLPPLLICAWLMAEPQKRLQTLRGCAIALASGSALFLLTWWIFCHCTGLSYGGVFRYLAESFGFTTVGSRAPTLRHIALSASYAMLWGLNPLWLAAIVISIRKYWQARHGNRSAVVLPPGSCHLCCGLWLLCGYAIIGGALFGFPKYQTPALAMLVVGVVMAWKEQRQGDLSQLQQLRRAWPLALAFASVAAVLLLIRTPDMLLALRAGVRELQAEGRTHEALQYLKPFALQQLVAYATAILLCAVAWHLGRRQLPLALMLLAAGAGINVALAIRQTTGGYCTGYIYGDKNECQNVAQMIVDRGWQQEPLLIPAELRQFLPRQNLCAPIPFTPQEWNDIPTLCDRIRHEKPRMIVASSLINPNAQMHSIVSNDELNDLLASEYTLGRLGHLWIWSRRAE